MAHTSWPRALGLAAALLFAATLALQASSPKFFQAATQADFLKGELDGLAIDSRGHEV
jgi:hypothetical protein